MSTQVLLRCVTAAASAAVLVTAAGGCAAGRHGPAAAADEFVSAFARHDTSAAAALTNHPDHAAESLAAAWDDLQAEQLTAHVGAARIAGDTATVEYTYRWRLPKRRNWSYTGVLQMGRSEGRWQVRWSASDIHPKLGDTQRLELRALPAPRARVNERAGSDVLIPGVVHIISFTASGTPEPAAAAGALAAALNPVDHTVTTDSVLAATRRRFAGPVQVAMLNDDEFDQVSGQLTGIPGVGADRQWDLLPTDRGFAPDLLAEVRKTVIDEVDGKAGWSVVTVNANGVDTDVLTESEPQPAPSFSLSVDRFVQNAAQQAVDRPADPAMMVVVQPSTGAILAVAQNRAADADGPVAMIGLYPPGSTFKTVTAVAAMDRGMATPDTVLPCPRDVIIGNRTIPNYNQFTIGDAPMSDAYERSCNTTFAKLASELPADALTSTAAAFGIGPDYTVAGMTTVSGSVPRADDLIQRTEDGIGQGRVLVSPFGMALLAATVARGSVPVPYLISGHETKIGAKPDAPGVPALSEEVLDGLRSMMRKVVTGGTAGRIADMGEVFGKTGEAEVDGGSHSWFVGYRGDLAFATLLVRGGSSDHAVAVTRDMLAALPPGSA
ncbi:penicillin-binding transpeptidase domain-containing protein [Nocardia aurantia]|nr:penicillin-binding transpeptidase domain-containing protein [Nocardia aurantia]